MKEKIEKLLTLDELADQSGLTVRFLRKAKTEMGLPSYKVGGLVKFKASEFSAWLSQRKVRSGPKAG